MIIKKYTAATETEAIMMAKEELGKDAIVMNIKTTKPRGFKRLFKKPIVELTAAVDENTGNNKKYTSANKKAESRREPSVITEESSKEENADLEARLDNLAKLLEQKMADEVKKEKRPPSSEKDVSERPEKKDAQDEESEKAEKSKKKLSELIYTQLRNNEVNENYARSIIGELFDLPEKSTTDDVLASVYQKIVLKLGEIHTIQPINDKANILFFVGPTGVGKTTTIAKLAAKMKLTENLKVAFITADTYRIAAEEQLKTYAGIMDIPIEVVYAPEEMKEKLEKFKDYDLVFVDTVGHSHKNKEQCENMQKLLDTVAIEQRDVFLVLSATTKYNDLIKITETYTSITKYSMIFTKLDETSANGNILNLKLATGAMLSYVAWGQNVPDDLGELDAQKIAKQLLGGNEGYGPGI